jgi:hypothetical protein
MLVHDAWTMRGCIDPIVTSSSIMSGANAAHCQLVL